MSCSPWDEKLDVADASAAVLDVDPAAELFRAMLLDGDLPQLADRVDDLAGRPLSEEERSQRLQAAVTHLQVARQWPQLEKRLYLPGLGAFLVVGGQRTRRRDDLPDAAEGPQAQVDSVGGSLCGVLGEIRAQTLEECSRAAD